MLFGLMAEGEPLSFFKDLMFFRIVLGSQPSYEEGTEISQITLPPHCITSPIINTPHVQWHVHRYGTIHSISLSSSSLGPRAAGWGGSGGGWDT